MSATLIIKNGFIFDPVNGINGERMDILIQNGRVVEKVNLGTAKEIDASGMLVMAGGVDIHSHIAGSKVDLGRIMRPEDHVKDFETATPVTRSGVGHSIPSTFITGYRYTKMGYSTVIEPATPPLKTRHTHEELNDTPIIDKACLPLFGNNWMVMEYLSQDRVEECAMYVAWMLEALRGYGIKLTNPGGVEAWAWGRDVSSLDDQVPNFNITPRAIIRGLCKVQKMLNLPHPIHVHPNNLGKPGNYETTIETMDCVKDLADGKPVIHMTHLQFESFRGSNWHSMSSGAAEIAKYINTHDHVTSDMGQVIFTNTTTMTADGPFQYHLHLLSGNKWVNADVEVETGTGVVPYIYRHSSPVNAIQWAIGLELALLIKDPQKIYLSTDNPNAGPFTAYPKIIGWLMSKKERDRIASKLPSSAMKRTDLGSIDRELAFSEIAVMTRAGPAKALGFKDKGHLGVDAIADVAIYPINPKLVDPSKNNEKVTKAFSNATYVIKDGQIVVNDGNIVKSIDGRTFWVKTETPRDVTESFLPALRSKFREYYTVEMDNYSIGESYLRRSAPIMAGM